MFILKYKNKSYFYGMVNYIWQKLKVHKFTAISLNQFNKNEKKNISEFHIEILRYGSEISNTTIVHDGEQLKVC